MANQIIGTIVSIGAPQTLTSNGGVSFTKRDLVVSVQKFDPNTGQPYSDQSNTPQITFMNQKGAELDRFQVGQLVVVYFDLSGRQYIDRDKNVRYINDIRGYRIEPYQAYQAPYQQAPAPAPAQNVYPSSAPAAPAPEYVVPEEVYPAPAAQPAPAVPVSPASPSSVPKNDGMPF